MLRVLLFIFTLGIATPAISQIRVTADNPDIDTLRVVFYNDKWAIEHEVETGENLFMLSRRFHVPPALLADMNGVDFQTILQPGSILYIPFGPYNQAKGVSANRFDTRPLSYVVRKYDNMFRLAHLAGVSQRTMQDWNAMSDNYLEEGRHLFVGWVLYDASDAPVADTVSVNKQGIENKKEQEQKPVQ
ncbi:MAG: LysM peptidoglycan-binding domain-containing protein, partial [Chitinophagaceae bacterium]|nr:LysM peptidoglycan-binding domain-containing protein [Chitinophagaceae bacterium]